jgi:hypothetical protein
MLTPPHNGDAIDGNRANTDSAARQHIANGTPRG